MIYTRHGKKIVVDTLHGTIEVVAPGNTSYVVKLIYNKDDVVRINKKSISTCNTEMLVYMLQHNNDVEKNVVAFITRTDDTIGHKLSRSAFYAAFNNDLDEFVAFFDQASHETRRAIIFDHCCTDHNAKMSSMISYSTFVGLNKFCQARRKKGCSVCAHCFAARQTKTYKDQASKLKRAHAIATMCEWAIEDIPIIPDNYKYFRLESFGDINNVLQVRNYNTLANALMVQGVKVTLWSKNPGIIQAAINDSMQLSDNLIIGLSSLELNKPEIDKARKYSFIKFLFTVFTDEYIEQHNIDINCGGRHCLSCLNCYELARNANKLILINEKLK